MNIEETELSLDNNVELKIFTKAEGYLRLNLKKHELDAISNQNLAILIEEVYFDSYDWDWDTIIYELGLRKYFEPIG